MVSYYELWPCYLCQEIIHVTLYYNVSTTIVPHVFLFIGHKNWFCNSLLAQIKKAESNYSFGEHLECIPICYWTVDSANTCAWIYCPRHFSGNFLHGMKTIALCKCASLYIFIVSRKKKKACILWSQAKMVCAPI